MIKRHDDLGQRAIGVLSTRSSRGGGANHHVFTPQGQRPNVERSFVVNPNPHDSSVARKGVD